jgi:hypothetical protein
VVAGVVLAVENGAIVVIPSLVGLGGEASLVGNVDVVQGNWCPQDLGKLFTLCRAQL